MYCAPQTRAGRYLLKVIESHCAAHIDHTKPATTIFLHHTYHNYFASYSIRITYYLVY